MTAISEREAKQIWKQLASQILDTHQAIDLRLMRAKTPETFKKYLMANYASTNHFEPQYTNVKVGEYGKLLWGGLLYVQNGTVYSEVAYYPLSQERFGLRIAVDDVENYSTHYMERLIQRKGIRTLEALKAEILYRKSVVETSGFVKRYGRVDVDTDYLVIYPDLVAFCYGERNDGFATSVRKSMITSSEYKGNQQEVLAYILKEFDCSCAVLTTHAIPRSISEAKNVIEDTIKRIKCLDQHEQYTPKKQISYHIQKANKKLIKDLIALLKEHDPHYF